MWGIPDGILGGMETMNEFIEILKSKPGIDYTMSEGKISVYGNLDLAYSDIEKLPDGLSVGGDLI